MSARTATVVILATLAACKGAPPKVQKADPLAPLACLAKAKQSNLDLSFDLRLQLCSGATDPDARVECFIAAERDSDINAFGALMLCSPFNLDAYNAGDRECPSVSTGGLESRLGSIDAKLDDIASRR